MQIRVECYAGYRGEETPRRFWLGNTIVEVREVLDRWLTPDQRYFRTLGDDNSIYIICHNLETWSWELTFYRKSGAPTQGDAFFKGRQDS